MPVLRPGGSANRVKRRDTVPSQPAVTVTETTGSSMFGRVRTRIDATPATDSSEAPTDDRGSTASPTATSADTQAGGNQELLLTAQFAKLELRGLHWKASSGSGLSHLTEHVDQVAEIDLTSPN